MSQANETKIEIRDVGTIKPYDKNAKRHPKDQIIKISKSIIEFGFNQPIVVDKNGIIIVGHGRYEAALHLKLKEVPVITLDMTEEKAKAYRLADNKLNESEWDLQLVVAELKELDPALIDLTGFNRELVIPGGDSLSLSLGGKGDLEQITFTLSTEQAEEVRDAIDRVMGTEEFKAEQEISGNFNKNGNAIAVIAKSYVS